MVFICIIIVYLLTVADGIYIHKSFCTKRYKASQISHTLLYSSRSNNDDNRPPIIPFDFDSSQFERKDVPANVKKDKSTNSQDSNDATSSTARKTNVFPTFFQDDDKSKEVDAIERQKQEELDRTRPTGYANNDDDDDENWVPSADRDPNESEIAKFLKDIYVGTIYDSRQKKQARYVVRNITFISIAIGIVFTFIWYAFPGKFISYKGTTDFSQRYQQSIITDTDSLLNDEFDRSDGSQYFDDAEGMPDQIQTRFPYEKLPSIQAPPPSTTL